MKVFQAKKTLATSIIAIIISFSILIGSTFAWFTDTASSGINKIQSGNLDVGLVYTNSYVGDPEEVNENTKIFMDINGDPILWEPGAFASGRFEVSNDGMLALKFELSIIQANATQTPTGKTLADALTVYALTRNKTTGTDAIMEDAKLEALPIDGAVPEYDPQNMPSFKDGLKLTGYLLPGESVTYEIGVYWEPTDNDNEFNVAGGLSIDFAVALVATQVTYESDGDGSFYDGNANFPEVPAIPSSDEWDGTADTSWYDESATTFRFTTSEELVGLAELVDAGNTFEGKTIKLENDVDLYLEGDDGEPVSFNPIGSFVQEKFFKGTFDGQGHTISNVYQNGWALENGFWDGDDYGMGLFAVIENATIKNLTLDGSKLPTEANIIGTLAGVAAGTCVYENITVSNAYLGNHSWYSGGLIGWAEGNQTFINCDVDETCVVSSQWGDFNNANGGLIGGIDPDGTYYFEDCDVACVIDAYNDVTSAYEWYTYRNCGMLIGETGVTKEINGTVYAAAPANFTCKNVTVTYGAWADYHYCEFSSANYPWCRVEAGNSTGAYGNARVGEYYDANGNKVVDNNHVHNNGEAHNELIVFDQLFGGPSGDRYYTCGWATHEGVTVVYKNASKLN